jgi:hypothetical protein
LLDYDDEDVHDHAIKGLRLGFVEGLSAFQKSLGEYLHNGDEDIDIDVEVAQEEAGRDHVVVDRDQVVTIHHSEEGEEGIGKGAETEFNLPEQTLPEDGIANEEGQDTDKCANEDRDRELDGPQNQ